MKFTSTGDYLKVKDVKRGEIVRFLDAGVVELSDKYTYDDGKPVRNFIFTVDYKGEKKKIRLNKASRVQMINAFGDESENWIGKEAQIFVMPTPSGNNSMILLEPLTESNI